MPQFNLPGATAILAVTIGLSLLGLYRTPRIIELCLFRPYGFPQPGRVDTIITSGFVHADLPHLLFNMFTFWFFAFPLEGRVGTLSFLALYGTGLVLSHACTWLKHKDEPHYASLGASGAISAVLFAYIVYEPATKLMILPIPVPIPAALFAVGYVAWSWWASNHERGRINHDAHLCGAMTGLLFVAVTDPRAFAGLGALLAR
ncbi:MAG TPA: rhomboid family intramembrane serine protease [Woeseiaceae bacterium]|jgi:membrane associated rhomboid family serine protease|nr:rhomboid family intramembrane serine protease [Woeseiaceae bacterium]